MKKTKKKQKKVKFILKNNYKESWNYIKDSKNFFWLIIGVFLAFALIGFFMPAPEYLSNMILDFIKELLEKTDEMSGLQLIRFIFLNNLQSSFFGIAFGIFLGIFPVLFAIANGYVIGFVSNMAVQEAGILSLWRLFPHGIFELPAVFISFGLGLRLGISVFNEKRFGTFKKNILSCLNVFVFVVIPLLIIAAIIEGVLIFFGG